MAKPLLPDALWDEIAPLIPPDPPHPKGGRPFVPARACLTGIIFVLKSGIPWELLPQEMGCGSGMTCWRRLRDWQAAGVWAAIHRTVLDKLGEADRIDWSRASFDSASVPAPAGGEATGPNPTDRGKAGTKHHLAVDGHGTPLAAVPTAANVPDGAALEAVVDAVPPVKRPRGRPRRRPAKGRADKAYDAARHRATLRRRHIVPRIARRGIETSQKLGRHRWKVERTQSWLHRFRRLRVRDERRADIHEAFLQLGVALLTWDAIQRLC
jgi:transposase